MRASGSATRGGSAGIRCGSTRRRRTTGSRACASRRGAASSPRPTRWPTTSRRTRRGSSFRYARATAVDSAVEGRGRLRRPGGGADGSRRTTSSWRRASCRSRWFRASPPSSIPSITQLHSSDYRNLAQLQEGRRSRRRRESLGSATSRTRRLPSTRRSSRARTPARSRRRSRRRRGRAGLPRALLRRRRTCSRSTRHSDARCARTSGTAARPCCGTGRRICSPQGSSASRADRRRARRHCPCSKTAASSTSRTSSGAPASGRTTRGSRLPLEHRRGRLPRASTAVSSPRAPGLYFVGMLFLHSFSVDADRGVGEGCRAHRHAHRDSANRGSGDSVACTGARAGWVVSERREHAAAARIRDADANPILVWNGLVTRMRRVGAERRGRKLARTQTTHLSENEEAPTNDERAAEQASPTPRTYPLSKSLPRYQSPALYKTVDEPFSYEGSL